MAHDTTYSAEKIIDAAVAVTCAEGIAAVTARRLARQLGCSVKPLFTHFENMDGIIAATADRARDIFYEYMRRPYEKHSFMRVGLRWLDFAEEEPNLYRLLFMPEAGAQMTSPLDIFTRFGGLTDDVLPLIKRQFELGDADALRLLSQMIIHAHGIACILVINGAAFPEQSLREIYEETAESLAAYYKNRKNRED